MSIRVREFGAGGAAPPWVLLHGWGFGGMVLEPLARRLAADRRVLVVDLPGWGVSPAAADGADPDALAAAVLAALPRPCRWLGWSLGALVALAAAAREPGAVSTIDLLAASPRFTRAPDWPGIDPARLREFAAAVAADPAAAHRRFLAFQLAGSNGAHRALRELRACAGREGLPGPQSMSAGLEMLERADLREVTTALSCPVRAVLGGADPLVPVAIAGPLGGMGVDVRVIEGAGHAPFLSHPEAVTAALAE